MLRLLGAAGGWLARTSCRMQLGYVMPAGCSNCLACAGWFHDAGALTAACSNPESHAHGQHCTGGCTAGPTAQWWCRKAAAGVPGDCIWGGTHDLFDVFALLICEEALQVVCPRLPGQLDDFAAPLDLSVALPGRQTVHSDAKSASYAGWGRQQAH